MMAFEDKSRLRPMIADGPEGPDTALVIFGFRDRAEIDEFMQALLTTGAVTPKRELQQ